MLFVFFPKLLLSSDASFFFAPIASEHNTGPILTYVGGCDSSTCDKFDGSMAKWFKIGKASDASEHMVSAGCQCVTLSSLLQSHASSARENTTYSERKTCVCDAPDPSTSRRLSSQSRDRRPPSKRDTRSAKPSSIHPTRKSASVAPKRAIPNQIISFPCAYN